MKPSSDCVPSSSSSSASSSSTSSASSSGAEGTVLLPDAEQQISLWLANSEVGRDPATIVLDYLKYCMTTVQTWKHAAGGHYVCALLSLPTGEIASCHFGDHKICIWREGVLVRELEGHTASVECLALLPSGDIASGSCDKNVKIWRNGVCIHTLEQGAEVFSLCVLGNGDLVCGLNARIKLWRDGQCVSTLERHTSAVFCLVTLSDGVEFASGSADDTIRIWRDGVCRQLLPRSHTDSIRCLICLRSGDLLSGSADLTIKVWRNGACVQTIRGHADWVYAMLALPNGDWLSGSDKTVKLWSSSGVCLKTIEMGSSIYHMTLVDALHVAVGLMNGEMKTVLL